MNLTGFINDWGLVWADFMVPRVLDTTLVFLLAGILWLSVKHRVSARFGYWLFVLVLAKCLMPAQLSIPGLVSNWFPAGGGGWEIVDFGQFGEGAGFGRFSPVNPGIPEAAASPSETAAAYPEWPGVLFLLWLAGTALCLLHQAWLEWKTRFMMRNTVPLDPKAVPLDLDELIHKAGIKRRVRWVTGHWVRSPVAYGYFRPAVAVPSDIAHHYTVRQLRWILLHELAHIKRGDAFVQLVQRIVQTLFFFHPFVWWANALIGRQREYACDDAALAGSQASPRECGEGFLGAVMRSNGLPTFAPATHGLIDYKTLVRKRLVRILDPANAARTRISLPVKTLLAAFALTTLPFGLNASFARVGEWIMVPGGPVNTPESRAMGEMVYDSGRDVVVMCGGWPITVPHNGTWEWKGGDRTWTQHPVDGPPHSYGFGMAYDPVRAKTVVSGGFPSFETLINAETWEWDGIEWKHIIVEDRPLGFTCMVFHPIRQTVIRQGGFAEVFNREGIPDTMEWDGTQWTPLPDGPPVALHRMVYDSHRNRLVAFGGIKRMGEISNETWEFDGTAWEKVAATGPEGREGHGMVFDSHRGATVLFGGTLWTGHGFPSDVVFTDMWEWNGKKWSRIQFNDIGNYTFAVAMAYDSKRRETVLFGGAETSTSYRPNDTLIFRFLSGLPKMFWSMF